MTEPAPGCDAPGCVLEAGHYESLHQSKGGKFWLVGDDTEPDRAFHERLPVRHAARMAIAALIDGDDGEAGERLSFLDAAQLKQVEDAAVALSLHAHRARTNHEQGEPR